MKILLIATNRHKQLMSRMDARPVPIGLAYVAGHLDPDRHQVKTLDLMFSEDYLADVEATVTDFQPDLVGISLRNLDNNSYIDPQWVLPITKEVVDAVRSVSEAPIVLGGPAFSLYPKECFDYIQPDVGVYGDGGDAFAQLAHSMESGEDFHRLPGMVYRSANGAVAVNGQVYSSFATPPRFDGLDMERYEKAGFGIGVVTKLGDNFNVTTPASRQSQSWRALRPIEEVISEVRDLKDRYGMRKVFFIDSGFNIPLAHAKSLCQSLMDADMGIHWNSYLAPVPDSFDLEAARLMKESGCGLVVMTGVDAGSSERSQEEQFDRVKHICELCEEGGIHYTISQSFGDPGETRETVQAKLDFLASINPAIANLRVGARIRPGTDLAQRALDEGLISDSAELIKPVFYMEKAVEDWLVDKLKEEADQRPRWNLV